MHLLFDRILFEVTDIGYLDSQTANVLPLLSYHLIIVLLFNLTHLVVVEYGVDLKIRDEFLVWDTQGTEFVLDGRVDNKVFEGKVLDHLDLHGVAPNSNRQGVERGLFDNFVLLVSLDLAWQNIVKFS